MLITHLEEQEKSKVKVYVDEEYAFILYKKEITDYNLCEGSELSLQLYEQILNNTVFPRAQEKALSLLKFMDRSELELRRKLHDSGFTESIINRAVTYVNSYGYLDDARYASAYLRARMNRKSKLILRSELLQKGVSREIIDKVFLEEYDEDEAEDAELNAIKKAIAKKTSSLESLSFEEKQKLIASLYRKGFEISKINQVLSNI